MSHRLGALMQAEFRELLEEIGVWMIYTRSDPRFPCAACRDLTTQDNPAVCGSCFGTGYRVQLERWRVYFTHELRKSAGDDGRLTPIGWTTEHQPIIFTPAHLVPARQDRFFMVEWDRPRDQVPARGRPLRISEVFKVVFIEPQLAGEVVYRQCHLDILTENVRAYETALFRAPLRITRP